VGVSHGRFSHERAVQERLHAPAAAALAKRPVRAEDEKGSHLCIQIGVCFEDMGGTD
jgi:hypothetical protein